MGKCSRPLVSVLFIIVLFSFESAGAWQNIGGDLQHSGYSESQPVPLELRWKIKIGNSGISAPIIDSGILFVGSDDNSLYAIDIRSGKLKWTYSTLGKVYTPAAKNGVVFAASFDNNIYALDYNGNLKWKYNTGSSVASPPIAYDNILYGGFDRNIYAIYIINGSLKWKYPTDGWVESAPAISAGILYAGSNDNNLYALDADNKNLKWKYQTGGSILSSPSIMRGVVYVGSGDKKIYAIDFASGELKWKKDTNDWIKSSPAVYENSVFIGSNDNVLYSFDTDNGDTRWKFRTNGQVDSPPVLIKDTVYAGSRDGNVYALDMGNGTLTHEYNIGSGIISLALSDNMLFATSEDGYVYAFGAPVSQNKETFPALPADTTPPEIKINPISLNVTSDKLTVSGTAEDPNGILVVTVNGINAGTAVWNATLTLSRGVNTITIVGVDRAGNVKTELRTVEYSGGEVSKETPPKITGFNLSSMLAGFILAVFLMKFKKFSCNA